MQDNDWKSLQIPAIYRMSLAHAWNAHEISWCYLGSLKLRPIMLNSPKIGAMWLFLLPLIIILGSLDVLTKGRTRHWPFPEQDTW